MTLGSEEIQVTTVLLQAFVLKKGKSWAGLRRSKIIHQFELIKVANFKKTFLIRECIPSTS